MQFLLVEELEFGREDAIAWNDLGWPHLSQSFLAKLYHTKFRNGSAASPGMKISLRSLSNAWQRSAWKGQLPRQAARNGTSRTLDDESVIASLRRYTLTAASTINQSPNQRSPARTAPPCSPGKFPVACQYQPVHCEL